MNIFDMIDNSMKESTIKGFFEYFYNEMIERNIYIDSNIFLQDSEGVNRLFDELLKYSNISIIMPKEQYEEIYNLKKNESDIKSANARNAFRRIEKLFDNYKLKIPGLNDKSVNSSTYADPVFIDLIIQDLKENQRVFFITEDKDLKIRLKSKIYTEGLSLNEDYIKIFSFNEQYENRKVLVHEFNKSDYEKACDGINNLIYKRNTPFLEKIKSKIIGKTYKFFDDLK